MANENDFHNNRPPSRRGRNLHPSRYVALETRRSGGEEEDNMDEYESLNFDRTTPPKNVRRTTTIPIPELKSSSCSSLSFAFCRQEGTGVRKREFSATESPLAQAQRLQDQGASANNSYSHRHRFLQSGLATTMDQVHKATEPYAATKNKGKISRASQSRSVDVLASALLETKKPKPRNTIDLCEDDDDDEHGENGNGVDHTHTHEHEVSSDLGDALQQSPNDAPGYIKALKHSKVHSPTIQGEYKNPRQRLPLDSSFTSPLMLDSPHTLTVPGMHSHPGDTNRCSSSPQNSRDSRKRSREGHRDTQTDNHIERPKVDFSNTPHSNSKVSCIKEASVAILASATRSATTIALQDSENSDDEPQRLFKKHKVGIWGKASSLIGQLLSPNTKKRKRRKKHKDRKIEYCEGTPTDQLPDDLRPTIQSDRTSSDDQINCTQDKSAAMRQMAEALEDEDDWIHHNPKEQRHAIQAGEKPWPPQVKKKDQEQLSEVLEEQDDWIHHNPKVQQPVNQTENEPWTPQAKKKNHEPMAEALEDDDDWSHRKPKAERPVIQSENEPSIPQVQRKDHEPEHKRGFHLSKANNNVKVVSKIHQDIRKNNSYGSSKPKTTKINPGCTFQQKEPRRSDIAWREQATPETPDSPSTPSTAIIRPTTRSSSKVYTRRYQEVVEIDDSDSEVEEVTISNEPIMEIELIRIAIGKKVATAECLARFDPNTFELHLTWKNTKRARTRSDDGGGRDSRTLALRDGTLEQFVVYRANEEHVSSEMNFGDEDTTSDLDHLSSFVAMHIVPTKENLLYRYSKSYIPDHHEPKFRYVVLEFRDNDIFSSFVDRCAVQLPTTVQLIQLEREQCAEYAQSLLANNHEEKKWRQRNKFVAGRALDYTLLVFPFVGDPSEIENAAEGLTEASRSTQAFQIRNEYDKAIAADLDQNDEDEGKSRQRAHFVTINVEDYDRLDPGEWLNDSLVDFWMQWISRDNTTLDSKFHFFTSHFFSRLSEDGPEAVASWTRRKKINIFEKKFVFIPINKSMHWSLCVVVNPGAIVEGGDRERTKDDPLSCMILMDSLRMHNKKTIAGTIRNWLNSEWRRMYKDILFDKSAGTGEGPFDNGNFKIFSPRVPLQNNTWDCGVFVCRYAHAIYELRYRDFTYRDAGMYCSEYESGRGATSKAFKELISDSAEFDFNMEDIARFRDEFKTLIEKLSGIYLKMKNAEKLLEQEQKRQQRKVTDEAPPSLAAKIETKPVSASSERERSVDAPVNLETHMYGGSSNQEFMIDRVRASTSRTIGRKDKENFKDWMGSKLVLELGGPFDRLEYASGNHAVQEERHDYTAMEDKSQYDDSLNVLNI